ncbi:MAG TPA: shikimate kinase [Gemmatimonadales bacterium]|nr:shikimate kinase [Gemmatimonadales bacterium]
MSTLWLIGMMGAGKTTIGRLVAALTDRAFVDLDAAVESGAGRSVNQIFVDNGEEAFRDLESVALAGVAGRDLVAACGGGAVLREGNRDVMRRSGLVVWLQAAPETLAVRLQGARDRPLLASGDVAGSLAVMEAERARAYREAAHHTVATDGRTPVEVAGEVVRLWR